MPTHQQREHAGWHVDGDPWTLRSLLPASNNGVSRPKLFLHSFVAVVFVARFGPVRTPTKGGPFAASSRSILHGQLLSTGVSAVRLENTPCGDNTAVIPARHYVKLEARNSGVVFAGPRVRPQGFHFPVVHCAVQTTRYKPKVI